MEYAKFLFVEKIFDRSDDGSAEKSRGGRDWDVCGGRRLAVLCGLFERWFCLPDGAGDGGEVSSPRTAGRVESSCDRWDALPVRSDRELGAGERDDRYVSD